eukprot:364903-Chlamydomonas_euryale.AAC.6
MFCKALVRFVFERLVQRPPPGGPLGLLEEAEAMAAAQATAAAAAADRPDEPAGAVAAAFGSARESASAPRADLASVPAGRAAPAAAAGGGVGGSGEAAPLRSSVEDLVSVLTALRLLLDAHPRLLGLLASASASAPLAACVGPAALLTGGRGWCGVWTASVGRVQTGDRAAAEGQSGQGDEEGKAKGGTRARLLEVIAATVAAHREWC